ncbi:EVE domain-containing protein [Photobacterium sp. 53610]|uniref:EVE domain-containing protein n=1 Tax=Photobacterium sp. 53610 TaxID=3102789 RepID=UPI002ED826AA
MTRFWVATASADHVDRGKVWGIMQVCHGKGTPLKRLSAGDWVVYYSPSQTYGQRSKLQAFTGICCVQDKAPYQVDIGHGFKPFRRDVSWLETTPIQIHPLLARLAFHQGSRHWGARFRYGLFEISAHDFHLIAGAMQCSPPEAAQLSLFPEVI